MELEGIIQAIFKSYPSRFQQYVSSLGILGFESEKSYYTWYSIRISYSPYSISHLYK